MSDHGRGSDAQPAGGRPDEIQVAVRVVIEDVLESLSSLGFGDAEVVLVDELAIFEVGLEKVSIPWHARCSAGTFGGYRLGESVRLDVFGLTICVFHLTAEPVFHRFIDWLDVAEQLGMTLTRPIVPDPSQPPMEWVEPLDPEPIC